MSARPLVVAMSLVVILAACSDTQRPADATVVDVGVKEYAFEPASLVLPAGTITFALRNEGTIEHEFEILRDDQVVDELEGLVPGLERDLTVTLEPGEYRYVCRLADHEQRGMVGTLTITDS